MRKLFKSHLSFWIGVLLPGVAAISLSAVTTSAETPPTYENFGERFFTKYCTSCHHTTRGPDERHGAFDDVNFDNLDFIRENLDLIENEALGSSPSMPPGDGVWPWDRDLLSQWILAGAPGEGQENLPVQNLPEISDVSLWYERMNFEVSRSNGMPVNERMVEIVGRSHFTGKQNILEEDIEIRREPDGSTVMLSQRRRKDGLPSNQFIKSIYDPPIPIVFANLVVGAVWDDTVRVTPRLDSGATGAAFNIDVIVTYEGEQVVDNGVGAPVEAHCVRINLHNPLDTQNPNTEEIWYMRVGVGPVRLVRSVNPSLISGVPSAEMGTDRAFLAASPEIRDDTTSLIPFENQTIEYAFEHQREVSLAGAQNNPTPTETPTLGPDYSRTPSPTFTDTGTPTSSATITETPSSTLTDTVTETFTPMPTDTITETSVPTVTVTETETQIPTATASVTNSSVPTPSPTHTETPAPATATPTITMTAGPAPNMADLDDNNVVDSRDLVLLMGNWGVETGPPPEGPAVLEAGDPRRSDVDGDQKVTTMDLLFVASYWYESFE